MTFLHRAVSSLFILVILVLAALGPQLANLRTPENEVPLHRYKKSDDFYQGPTVNPSFQPLRSVQPMATDRSGADYRGPRSNSTAGVPVFVKLHVVGSSTFTSLVRCLSGSRRTGPFELTGNNYWSVSKCGQEQGHGTAQIMSRSGAQSLLCCIEPAVVLQPGLAVKVHLVALLRNPLEKYISSVYTFASGNAKKLLQTTVPGDLTLGHIGLSPHGVITVNVWGNQSSPKHRSVRDLEMLRLNNEVRGTIHETRDVFRTTKQFKSFSVVGITEEYDRFLTLVGLVMNWPMESLCYPKKLHTNPSRPPLSAFDESVVLALSFKLRADTALYEFAKNQHYESCAQFSYFNSAQQQRIAYCKSGSDSTVCSGAGSEQRKRNVGAVSSGAKCEPHPDVLRAAVLQSTS